MTIPIGQGFAPASMIWRGMNKRVTKKCSGSGQVAETDAYVTCPECQRGFWLTSGRTKLPTHYVRRIPNRDDLIATTRLYLTDEVVMGPGNSIHGGAPGKHHVWRLVYKTRSYRIWRQLGKAYYWNISPDDGSELNELNPDTNILMVAESPEEARGIVVDWGEGGSVYE